MATILASLPHLVEGTSSCNSWQLSIRNAIRDPAVLLQELGIPSEKLGTGSLAPSFPLLVPREFVARMQPGNLNDPLLRQILPTAEELAPTDGFQADPVGDNAAEVIPGLLQKYAGRALLVTTGACAVHCRYCFRREFQYERVPKSPNAWQPAIDYIAQDSSLSEILLSGGDPLMLADSSLSWLVDQLNRLPHIQRLRIHTRVPVMIPQRICDELLSWIRRARMQVIFVTHINHAQEIDDNLRQAIDQLRTAGVLLLNQSVLLRGINDTVAELKTLSERLVAMGVLPYYLHQLDRVRGAAHFEVPVSEGRDLIAQLRALVPGYCVPKYVAEIAGEVSKRPL